MDKHPAGTDVSELRARAEKVLAEQGPGPSADGSDTLRLLHTLQVHQIELEMQNEALRQAQAENQEALRQLALLNDHLEELVEVRTADLATARDAAEAASRAKSEFLANMSHELRTPMNAIMGMTDLALRQATDPRLVRQLTMIKDASRHLMEIINDVLDLSKIEADRLRLASVEFKLESVMKSLASMVAPQADQKGLAFHIEISPELSNQPLRGDPMHLTQILLNLLYNAIKFTARGSVMVRVTPEQVSGSEITLRFEVIDTGIGVSAENHQRIFNAFEQADGSMTRKFGGTGLGLAISRRLAQLMGGDIGVRSVLGQGSTFWLSVRLGKASETSLTAPTLASMAAVRLKAEFAGARVLLAEDEPVNQEVTRTLLEEVGLVVDVAENGREAVDLARDNDYALILMDIRMPSLNGLKATQEIRRIPGREDIPILAMTANVFDEDRRLCLEAGMNDHLGKPVEPEQLFNTLLDWLSR